MYPTSKIGSFMTLRANGWSLDKIAKKLNVAKTTLWTWDNKHQNEIHLLKHMQLERLQEQYLPSYEDELKTLTTQLNRIEQALSQHDLATLGPAFLLQISLQLRDRLSKMRHHAPLRTVPYGKIEPLPVTGCVTADENYPWVQGDPAIEEAEDTAEDSAAAESAANGKPHHNGSITHNGHSNGHASTLERFDTSAFPDSATKTEHFRTQRDGGQISDPLSSTTCENQN